MLIRKAVRLMLGPHRLFITNLVSSGVLMGLGDWAVQQAVKRTEKTQQKTDWPRTGKYLLYQFLLLCSCLVQMSASVIAIIYNEMTFFCYAVMAYV